MLKLDLGNFLRSSVMKCLFFTLVNWRTEQKKFPSFSEFRFSGFCVFPGNRRLNRNQKITNFIKLCFFNQVSAAVGRRIRVLELLNFTSIQIIKYFCQSWKHSELKTQIQNFCRLIMNVFLTCYKKFCSSPKDEELLGLIRSSRSFHSETLWYKNLRVGAAFFKGCVFGGLDVAKDNFLQTSTSQVKQEQMFSITCEAFPWSGTDRNVAADREQSLKDSVKSHFLTHSHHFYFLLFFTLLWFLCPPDP